jgi:hypothetical protein
MSSHEEVLSFENMVLSFDNDAEGCFPHDMVVLIEENKRLRKALDEIVSCAESVMTVQRYE